MTHWYQKLIEWGLPSHLLIFAPASAWSLLHNMSVSILWINYSTTCLSPSSLSALLHMCRDALVGQKLIALVGFPSDLHDWFASSAHPFSLVINPSMEHVVVPLCLHFHMCRDAKSFKSLYDLKEGQKLRWLSEHGWFLLCTPFPRRILAWSFVTCISTLQKL